jgi:Immunity protein 26
MAKRFKLNEGDLFTIPLNESEFGIGQIVCFPNTSDAFIIIVFDKKYSSSQNIDFKELVTSEILFLGYTFDAKLYYKDWNIMDNIKSNIADVKSPFFKLGTIDDARLVNYKSEELKAIDKKSFEQLSYKTEIAPIRYENALKAHFGLKEWKAEDYDKILYKKTLESIKVAEKILKHD